MIRLFSKAILGFLLTTTVLTTSTNAQLNLKSNAITFRTSSTAGNQTVHYGDLNLSGGDQGMSWGWLYTNQINCFGSCYTGYISVGGDLDVYGTKNFIQAHPTDTNKAIKYVAIESGEALTVVRGTGKTVGGITQIILPEHFALVTSSIGPITVLTTPEDAPAILYVKAKTKQSFSVGMKNSDYLEFGDVKFSYQVTGVRDGFENLEPIVDLDKISKNVQVAAIGEPEKKRLEFAKRYENAHNKGKK